MCWSSSVSEPLWFWFWLVGSIVSSLPPCLCLSAGFRTGPVRSQLELWVGQQNSPPRRVCFLHLGCWPGGIVTEGKPLIGPVRTQPGQHQNPAGRFWFLFPPGCGSSRGRGTISLDPRCLSEPEHVGSISGWRSVPAAAEWRSNATQKSDVSAFWSFMPRLKLQFTESRPGSVRLWFQTSSAISNKSSNIFFLKNSFSSAPSCGFDWLVAVSGLLLVWRETAESTRIPGCWLSHFLLLDSPFPPCRVESGGGSCRKWSQSFCQLHRKRPSSCVQMSELLQETAGENGAASFLRRPVCGAGGNPNAGRRIPPAEQTPAGPTSTPK